MWRASERFLTGPPPFPPRRWPGDPRDALRVKPWWTLRELARAHDARPAAADGHRALRDLRGRRPAPRAGGARRRRVRRARLRRVAPARRACYGSSLALARAARRRSAASCASRRPWSASWRARARVAACVTAAGEPVPADAVVADVDDARRARRLLGRPRAARASARSPGSRCCSALRGRTPASPTTRSLPRRLRRRVRRRLRRTAARSRDPTIYVSASCATDPGGATRAGSCWSTRPPARADWDAEAERWSTGSGCATGSSRARAHPGRPGARDRRPGGAIYGAAPHGRLGTLKRRPGSASAASRAVARRRHGAPRRRAAARGARRPHRRPRGGISQRVAPVPQSPRRHRARNARTTPPSTSRSARVRLTTSACAAVRYAYAWTASRSRQSENVACRRTAPRRWRPTRAAPAAVQRPRRPGHVAR